MAYPVFVFIPYAGKVSVSHVVYYHFYEIKPTANFKGKHLESRPGCLAISSFVVCLCEKVCVAVIHVRNNTMDFAHKVNFLKPNHIIYSS